MKNDTKILFAMNNFRELGIQKVIVTIMNQWDNSYGDACLSVHNTEGDFFEHLNTKCQLYELEKIYPSHIPIHFLAHTRAYIKLLREIKPTKVVAVNQAEALSLCIAKRYYKDFKLMVCEHCNISESINDYQGWFGWYYRHFFQREYNKYADVIHTVSYESKVDMVNNWGFPSDKIKVIYNPALVDDSSLPKHEGDTEYFTIVAASRLEQQKRIDILLQGLWTLFKQHIELKEKIRVMIYGDGSLRKTLESLSNQLGLNDVVQFYGFIKDPWKKVADADLFVSTSEWEGLSVSLIEAQTVHTPILASDCPSGNKEICMYGEAGKLFKRNDPKDFADKLYDIILNRNQLKNYVNKADENLYRFDVKAIMKQYAEF